MTAYSPAPRLASYRAVAAHGGVAAADPHGLVVMLMNGAVERISTARGCIKNKALAEKSQLIHRAVALIDQLRDSLNMQTGGTIAENLDNLYDYMCRKLLQASVDNDVAGLDEVLTLLQQIRGAWLQMPRAKHAEAQL